MIFEVLYFFSKLALPFPTICLICLPLMNFEDDRIMRNWFSVGFGLFDLNLGSGHFSFDSAEGEFELVDEVQLALVADVLRGHVVARLDVH